MNQRLKLICLIVPLAVCFGLPLSARATDTDGALPNGNNADGIGVLTNLTTGAWNSGFGFEALNHDTIGSLNTATGLRALFNNTEGDANTANGMYALFSNTTGDGNVAVGAQALVFNTDGFSNTAVGTQALFSNMSGFRNTATGYQALSSNTTGNFNTANGMLALFSNTEGDENTANGASALGSNNTGNFNTANGVLALSSNITGDRNTAVGNAALSFNIDGFQNTAIGVQALISNTTGRNNTAIGLFALGNNTTGQDNIGVGAFGGANLTTGDFNIDIFSHGVAGDDRTIRIGEPTHLATFIGGISSSVVAGGVTVVVGTDGHLGTIVSSQRFKEEMKPMDKASEVILALKPVTFRYKKELDPNGIPQFGLVAEDVEKVNPDLVARDAEGKVYTVRYEAVNAMLLNEFIKEHRKVEQQEATIAQLRKGMEGLVARLNEQDSKIEKVSAQVAVSKPAPQTVLNNH
jgi:hypothetical protein